MTAAGLLVLEGLISEIESRVEALVASHLPAPFTLYAVEWGKQGPDFLLSVLVDRPGGIEIDETATLAELISPLLDTLSPDPFPAEGYMLEVASPGAERPLKTADNFADAVGENVSISLYQKLEGEKSWVGELLSADSEKIRLSVTFKTRKKEIEIPVSAVAKAQTILLF